MVHYHTTFHHRMTRGECETVSLQDKHKHMNTTVLPGNSYQHIQTLITTLLYNTLLYYITYYTVLYITITQRYIRHIIHSVIYHIIHSVIHHTALCIVYYTVHCMLHILIGTHTEDCWRFQKYSMSHKGCVKTSMSQSQCDQKSMR